MDNEIKNLLNEEIKRQLADMDYIDTGDEKKASATQDVERLCKLVMESEKTEAEIECNKKEASGAKKDRIIKIVIGSMEIVLPLAFYAVWMCVGLKFEETGCFTSTTFKGLLNRFRPTK